MKTLNSEPHARSIEYNDGGIVDNFSNLPKIVKSSYQSIIYLFFIIV